MNRSMWQVTVIEISFIISLNPIPPEILSKYIENHAQGSVFITYAGFRGGGGLHICIYINIRVLYRVSLESQALRPQTP